MGKFGQKIDDMPTSRSLKTLATVFSVDWKDKRLVEVLRGGDNLCEFCSKGGQRNAVVARGRCLVKTF